MTTEQRGKLSITYSYWLRLVALTFTGAAAFAAGTTHTLSSSVIICELTGQMTHLGPIVVSITQTNTTSFLFYTMTNNKALYQFSWLWCWHLEFHVSLLSLFMMQSLKSRVFPIYLTLTTGKCSTKWIILTSTNLPFNKHLWCQCNGGHGQRTHCNQL